MKYFYWELKIRVDGRLVNTYQYPTKKDATINFEALITRGLHVFAENKKFPKQFSYSLIKRDGKMRSFPTYIRGGK